MVPDLPFWRYVSCRQALSANRQQNHREGESGTTALEAFALTNLTVICGLSPSSTYPRRRRLEMRTLRTVPPA